ncbi:TPA: hypothetical protein ACH3X2_001758 [Trebouxia sp. C0005]
MVPAALLASLYSFGQIDSFDQVKVMRGWWHVGGVLFTRHSYNKSCARGSTATLRVHSSRFARLIACHPEAAS